MRIITKKPEKRLVIKKKRSDLIVEPNAALAWELDCKEVYYERD